MGRAHGFSEERHSVGGSVIMSEQSNGQARPKMTNQLEHIRKEILPKVQKHKHAWPFQKPVNPKELGLPDYFDVIKKPMDLSTIRKKFDQKKYNFGREALADFETMFSNCYLYNKPTDDVTLMCQAVESFFKDLVKKMDAHDNLKVEVEVEPSTPKSKGPKKQASKKVRPPPTVQKTEPAAPRVAEEVKAHLADTIRNDSRRNSPKPPEKAAKTEPSTPISTGPKTKPFRRGIKRSPAVGDQKGSDVPDPKKAKKRKRWS